MYTKLRTFRINYKFIIRKQPSEGLKLSIPVGGGLWLSVFIVFDNAVYLLLHRHFHNIASLLLFLFIYYMTQSVLICKFYMRNLPNFCFFSLLVAYGIFTS